ncbi:MAG: hypothetical protein WAM66_10795 [Acidobacteriaceae bacterium]
MPVGVLDFPDIATVYARFAALTALSADLGGWLLLYARLDRDGVAVAMASNVAGAASLGVEPDAELAKAALRSGVCDFVVINLGEALRILKNEIRKHNAVSVLLTDEVDPTIREIIARGVQPEVLAFPVTELMERGARVLASDGPGALDGMVPVSWSVEHETLRWLPALDELAVRSLETADARVRWIEASPRYLGRAFAGRRFVRMTMAEADAFVAAAREAVAAGSIQVPVSVTRGDEVVSIAP